jgi:endoglucanase
MTRLALASAVAVGALVLSAGLAAIAPTSSASAAAGGSATVTRATIKTAPTTTVYAGGLYVQRSSEASRAADALAKQGRTRDAAAARTIAGQSVAIWLGSWYTDAQLVEVVRYNLAEAEKAGTTPVFVTYDIPNRDCGGFSGGGAASSAAYLTWNQRIADTLRGHRAVVIVEPDALAHLSSCPELAAGREATIKKAVSALSAAGVPSYIDAGNSNWVPADVMAKRLVAAGVGVARGFATNVSNYYPVANEVAYAEKVSSKVGGARYVVDVSRNGRGWKGTWCNAPGAGLGVNPHRTKGTGRLDAQLWIKTPGASDGPCNGGPAAGAWFPSYATALVANRP